MPSKVEVLRERCQQAREEEGEEEGADDYDNRTECSSSDGFDEDSQSDEEEPPPSSSDDPKSDTIMVLPSLFADRPATVWFDYAAFSGRVRKEARERIVELTGDKEQPLLFRSNHTIVCLGGALKRSGFRRLLKGTTYNIFWGHHLKEHQLQRLHPAQCVNHFPGSYTLGRKDYLWRNISKQARQHPAAYDFCAKSFILPRDRKKLEKDYEVRTD